jgi:uncharacterized protein
MNQKKHRASCSNRDFDFFYEGLEAGKILVQRCTNCGELRTPPGPMCPYCNSLSWRACEMTGEGTIYSYIVHHYPPLPGFDTPHPVGLIALDEGVRLIAGLDGMQISEISIGVRVKAEFIRRGEVASVRFWRV